MQSTYGAGRRRAWRVVVAGTAGAALIGLAALQPASAQQPEQVFGEGAVAEVDPMALPEAGSFVSSAQARAADEYWTEERMAEAEPMEPPAVDAAVLATAPRAASVLPRKTAPGTVPDGAAAGIASVDQSSVVSVAERWNRQGEMPARTTGQLYFTRTDGRTGRCTASVITSENQNLVWTAGHCIHDGESGPSGFYRNIMYVPDADNDTEPHGRWHASYVNAALGWTTEGRFSHDYAGVSLFRHAEHGTVEGHLGAQGYDFGGERVFDHVLSLGYPRRGYQRDDFTGRDLWSCQGPTRSQNHQIHLTCDMANGASGSPWLHDFDPETGTGHLVSVHSNSIKASDGTRQFDWVLGPELGDGAIALYEDVTTTCQIPVIPDGLSAQGC